MNICDTRKYRIRIIICKCGRRIFMLNPLLAMGPKSHGHCKECNLEWHWHVFKGVYSHKIKRKKRRRQPNYVTR